MGDRQFSDAAGKQTGGVVMTIGSRVMGRAVRSMILPLLAVSLGVAAFPNRAQALNCQQVRQLTHVYFKLHFSFNEFDDVLSTRTLDNFLKAWDPGKVYFLQSDIDRFSADYGNKLDDMINAANCKAIEDVVNVYSKRFAERQKSIDSLIAAKHDFTLEEYMEIDRKNMPWAKTTEEITERWRKRIKFQLLQLNDTLDDTEKARQKLTKRYQLGVKRQQELTSNDVYAWFLSAFSSGLDPHSDYMAPEQLEDFRIQTRLSLEGIGAVLRAEDGFTNIQSLVPGGAAFKTGKLKVDDKIIAVAQGAEAPVDVIDMDLREVVKLIRGTRGTEVRLTIMRDEADKSVQLVVPVIRDKVELKDRAARSRVIKAQVNESAGPRTLLVGVIQLPSFYMDFEGRANRESNFTSSSADVRRELKALQAQNVDGVIVDLRGNGGGSLDEAINVAGLFTGKGPVVQTRAQDGAAAIQSFRDSDAVYTGPLVVMINRQSASASEIFAGAIQDYGRGVIVGDHHTFGKGTVQNLTDIDEKLGAVKVTISKFYRPSGSSTQLRGVESDIVFPDLLDELEIGEKHYDYALPWEKIKAAEYRATQTVAGLVPKLRTASNARTAKDPGFQKIIASINEYRAAEAERNRVCLKEGGCAKDGEAKTADKNAAKEAKSKDNKAGGKKGDKKDAKPAADDPDAEVPIDEDFHLQEAARIGADLVQSLKGRPLADVRLPDVKPPPPELVQTSAAATQAKADAKDSATGKGEPKGPDSPNKPLISDVVGGALPVATPAAGAAAPVGSKP